MALKQELPQRREGVSRLRGGSEVVRPRSHPRNSFVGQFLLGLLRGVTLKFDIFVRLIAKSKVDRSGKRKA